MSEKRFAFTLTELIVALGMIGLLIAALGPSLSRARALNNRLCCADNLIAIGTACTIYAGENQGSWMVPGHRSASMGGSGIVYTGPVGDVNDRHKQSLKETSSGQGGSTKVCVTRAYWMLVRSGDLDVRQFVCPSSGDQPDPTEVIDVYYDFESYDNISYGYQVPFGPSDTRPREGAHPDQVFGGDKGPYYYSDGTDPDWDLGTNVPLLCADPEEFWRPFNSPNHDGEGQNCLYADGTVVFVSRPCVAVDRDNIYTGMENYWEDETGRTHGLPPGHFPGWGAFEFPYQGPGVPTYASTDSLIYP